MSRHLRRIERMDTGRKSRVVPENAWPGGLASLELHVNVARFTAALADGFRRASLVGTSDANHEAIEAVLELHRPIPENNPFLDMPLPPTCLECGWEVSHPCPTVEAVTKALH